MRSQLTSGLTSQLRRSWFGFAAALLISLVVVSCGGDEKPRTKRPRQLAVSITECLRTEGAKVSTESNDVRDQGLLGPDREAMRLNWRRSNADIAVLGSSDAAEELRANTNEERRLAKGNAVVIFDDRVPRDSVIEAGLQKCL